MEVIETILYCLVMVGMILGYIEVCHWIRTRRDI